MSTVFWYYVVYFPYHGLLCRAYVNKFFCLTFHKQCIILPTYFADVTYLLYLLCYAFYSSLSSHAFVSSIIYSCTFNCNCDCVLLQHICVVTLNVVNSVMFQTIVVSVVAKIRLRSFHVWAARPAIQCYVAQWRRQLFWVGRPKGGQDIFRGASLYDCQ